MFDGELTATQCLIEGDGLGHDEVNACPLEDWVVFLLQDDYDIACITVRLGREGGREWEGGRGEEREKVTEGEREREGEGVREWEGE